MSSPCQRLSTTCMRKKIVSSLIVGISYKDPKSENLLLYTTKILYI